MNSIAIFILAAVLGIKNRKALRFGLNDGYEQGEELSMGMSYDDLADQWAYDTGTRIGACLRVRFGQVAA